jgi:hypothetical protein
MKAEKLNKTYRFTRENFKEWFTVFLSMSFVKDAKEGMVIPRFYLPVQKPLVKYGYECWIFPLAGFVWIYYVLRDVFWCIWKDMRDLQRMMIEWREAKKQRISND